MSSRDEKINTLLLEFSQYGVPRDMLERIQDVNISIRMAYSALLEFDDFPCVDAITFILKRGGYQFDVNALKGMKEEDLRDILNAYNPVKHKFRWPLEVIEEAKIFLIMKKIYTFKFLESFKDVELNSNDDILITEIFEREFQPDMTGFSWSDHRIYGDDQELTTDANLKNYSLCKKFLVVSIIIPEIVQAFDSETINKTFEMINDPAKCDPFNAFCQHIEFCFQKFYTSDREFQFPYIALVQSSGYGKSRLLKSLHEKMSHVYKVSYVCVRPSISSGFPPRSESIHGFIGSISAALDESNLKARSVRYLKFLMKNSALGKSFQEFYEMTYQDSGHDCVLDPRLKYIICFDEAVNLIETEIRGKMVNMFRIFRRALNEISGSYSVLGILTDTFGKLEFLNPVEDKSARNELGGTKLLDPFHRVYYRDLFITNSTKLILSSGILRWKFDESLDFEEYNKKLFSSGRPLWNSYLESSGGTKSVIRIAITKLFCGCGSLSSLSDEQKLFCLTATLAFKCGDAVQPSPYITSDLIAGFMATCRDISDDRKYLEVTFPSEYPLSLASSYIWKWNTDEMFELLYKAFSQGAIDRGEVAEVFSSLLFCLASDSCAITNMGYAETQNGYPLVKLEDLLQKICGSNLKLPAPFNTAYVNFTSFEKLSFHVSKDVIFNMLFKRFAGLLRQNTAGSDMVIPLLWFHFNDPKYPIFEVGICFIQGKNYGPNTNVPSWREWTTHLYPPYVFQSSPDQMNNWKPKTFGILLNTGLGGDLEAKPWELQKFPQLFTNHPFLSWLNSSVFLKISGISRNFNFLTENHKTHLRNILTPRCHILQKDKGDLCVEVYLSSSVPNEVIAMKCANPKIFNYKEQRANSLESIITKENDPKIELELILSNNLPKSVMADRVKTNGINVQRSNAKNHILTAALVGWPGLSDADKLAYYLKLSNLITLWDLRSCAEQCFSLNFSGTETAQEIISHINQNLVNTSTQMQF